MPTQKNRQEIIDLLTQCGGLSYNNFVDFLYSIPFLNELAGGTFDGFISKFTGMWNNVDAGKGKYDADYYATYNNKIYRSAINNNTSVPGANASWVLQGSDEVTGVGFQGTAVPSDDPGAPTGNRWWLVAEEGTYTDFSGVVLPANSLGVIADNGTAYSIGYFTMSLENYVTKDFLFTGQNKYDYNEDLETGYYIDSTGGGLIANGTSKVSKVYPTTPGEILYVFNRTGNGGFRFLDASNNPIKPHDINDVPFPLYGSVLNGAFKAPPLAVGWQLTTQFVGTTNRTNMVVTDSPTGNLLIKEELIPEDPEVNEALEELRTDVDANTTALELINSDSIPPRLNKNESTNTPEAFPTATETLNFLGVVISDDTTSPSKDVVGKKRTFLNTMTPDGSSVYRIWDLPLGAERPPLISVAFWVKKTQFNAIFTTTYDTYLGLRVYHFTSSQIGQMLAGTPIVSTGNVSTITEFTTATCTITKIAEDGDYVRIRQTYSEILWKGSFVGSTIRFYFLFNGNNGFQNKPLEMSDFTTLFNDEPENTIIYPDPDGLFGSNVKSLKGVEDQIALVNEALEELEEKVDAGSASGNSMAYLRNMNELYFSSPWDLTRNLVKRMDVFRPSGFLSNANANFVDTRLATKGGDQTVSILTLKASSDDICPANINGGYIGANHGWNKAFVLTKTAHGKTLSDVGNVYLASGIQFVILRIIDANNIWATSKNQAVDGFTYSFVTPVGDLVYQSGNGANQGTITAGYTLVGLSNMWPSVTSIERKILINGKTELTANGDYQCDFCDVVETYDVHDYPSMIQKLIDGRPVGGYLTQPKFNELGADKLINHSIVYRFLTNGTTLVFHNFRTYKKIVFNFHGFIQAGALNIGDIYVPKALPISDGVKTYDLRKIEPWTTGPAIALYLDPAYWEDPTSPPDRIINKNSDVIFHLGYVTDRGVGFERENNVTRTIFLNTSKKLYPFGVDNGLTPQPLDANNFYSALCFRQFLNPANNPAGRTNYSWFEVDGSVFVYLDYHISMEDSIPMPVEWAGKKIEIQNKTSNIIILGDVVTSRLIVSATVGVNGYAQAVLKFV